MYVFGFWTKVTDDLEEREDGVDNPTEKTRVGRTNVLATGEMVGREYEISTRETEQLIRKLKEIITRSVMVLQFYLCNIL